MKTLEFNANIGVTPGYFHNNTGSIESTISLWQDVAEEVFQNTGVYVSATATPSITVYRKAWGCPEGGEVTVLFSGLWNLEFVEDPYKWTEAVKEVCEKMRKTLGQSTAYLTFKEVEFYYMR